MVRIRKGTAVFEIKSTYKSLGKLNVYGILTEDGWVNYVSYRDTTGYLWIARAYKFESLKDAFVSLKSFVRLIDDANKNHLMPMSYDLKIERGQGKTFFVSPVYVVEME